MVLPTLHITRPSNGHVQFARAPRSLAKLYLAAYRNVSYFIFSKGSGVNKKNSDVVVIFLTVLISLLVKGYLTDSVSSLNDLPFFIDSLVFLAIYLVIYFPLNSLFGKFVVNSTNNS